MYVFLNNEEENSKKNAQIYCFDMSCVRDSRKTQNKGKILIKGKGGQGWLWIPLPPLYDPTMVSQTLVPETEFCDNFVGFWRMIENSTMASMGAVNKAVMYLPDLGYNGQIHPLV